MVSTGTNRIVLSVTLAGIVIMATACSLHSQTRQPSEVKSGTTPNSTTPNSSPTPNGVSTGGATKGGTATGATTTSGRSTGISTPELVPAASEPRAVSPPSEPQATTTRPANDADDPRAVIDWLLDRSSRGR